MLNDMQQQLAALYQVDTDYRIDDFLITDPALAAQLGTQSMLPDTAETVLLAEDEQGMSMSVFLDRELLERLDAGDPLSELKPAQLDDWWLALEGVSHFLYLAWCGQQDRSVTLLELEMQAEVDKFVSTWLLALSQDDQALAARLHGWLFDDVSFHPGLSHDGRERYRAANDYAGRFCHGLRERLQEGADTAFGELRHFYRLTQQHKISHIHAHAWGTA